MNEKNILTPQPLGWVASILLLLIAGLGISCSTITKNSQPDELTEAFNKISFVILLFAYPIKGK